MRFASPFTTAWLCLFSLGSGLFSVATAGPAQIAAPGPGAGSGGAVGKPKIVASVHAKNLEVTLGLVRDYLPVPWKPETLILDMFGDFGGQVILSAPVSLVVGVDAAAAQSTDDPAPPLWAFAVTLRSLDEAQKLGQSRGYLTGSKAGLSQLQLQPGGRKLFCLLGPGVGGSGRLACAKQERDRDVLAPYLVGLKPPSQTSDVHAEILVDAVVGAYDAPWQRLLQLVSLVAPQKLKLGEPGFDRALTDVTQALVGQLQAMSRDLQTLAIDLSLAKTGIEARLAYRLIGQASWWAQAELEPSGNGAPPLFFTLPADSMAASFQQSDPKWAKKVLDLLIPLLDGYLAHDGLAAADRQFLSDVIQKTMTLPQGAPLQTVMATGKGPDGPAPATGGFDPVALLSGNYYLVATEGANEAAIPWLKSIVAAYNRPGIQAYLRTKWKKVDPTGTLPTLKAEPLPKGVPSGGYGLVLNGSFAALSRAAGAKSASGKGRPLVLHLITVPVNGRLWTALGGDRVGLAQRLADATGQPAKTLAQRSGIEALREPGLRSGGFTSLVAMSSYLDGLLLATSRKNSAPGSAAEGQHSVSASQLFSMAPHHGEVPMVYVWRRGAQEPSARSAEFILRVPRMVIEDIAALAMQMAMEK